jgi:hypothetical protein
MHWDCEVIAEIQQGAKELAIEGKGRKESTWTRLAIMLEETKTGQKGK